MSRLRPDDGGVPAALLIDDEGRLLPRPLPPAPMRERAMGGDWVTRAIGVRLPIFMHRIALPFGAFTEHDQRGVARVGALVLEKQLDELVEIHLVLGDDTADGGCVGGIERRKAGIAAEDAKKANALMRADGSSLPLDRVAGAGDRRRESDAPGAACPDRL